MTDEKTALPERRGIWKKLLLSLLPVGAFVWLLQRGALPLVPEGGALARVPTQSYVVFVLVWSTMYALRTSRWYFLLAAVERVPFWTVIRVGTVGLCAVAILPFRMGEAVRPILIRQQGRLSAWAATGTVGAERVIDGLSVSVLLLVSLWLARPMDSLPDRIGDLPVPASLVPSAALSAASIFAAGCVVMGLFYWRRASARRVTELVLGVVSRKFARWVAARLEEVAAGLGFLTQPRFSLPFLLLTVGYWALNAATYWVLLEACGIGSLGFFNAAATMGVVALGIMVPATPGFFGAYQLGIYAGLAMYLEPEVVIGAGSTYAFLAYVLPMGLTILMGLGGYLAGLVARPPRENLPEAAGPG
jgi:uncharacterized protein (TIRG00374 family)